MAANVHGTPAWYPKCGVVLYPIQHPIRRRTFHLPNTNWEMDLFSFLQAANSVYSFLYGIGEALKLPFLFGPF